MKTNTFSLHLAYFFLEWEMFRAKIVEKIKIWYLTIFFRKYVERIEVSLNPDKNNEHITWRPILFYYPSLISS